jgi:hypothetical protein
VGVVSSETSEGDLLVLTLPLGVAFVVETEDGELSDGVFESCSCFDKSTDRPLGVLGLDIPGDGTFALGEALSSKASPSMPADRDVW